MPELCHVMVVDDDDGIRDALAMVISEEGCDVVCASNGEEALTRLRASERLPCLILLDLMMPVMDGRAFREAQLQDPVLAEVPVVVLTAAGYKTAVKGAQICLAKPIRLETLLNVVAGYC